MTGLDYIKILPSDIFDNWRHEVEKTYGTKIYAKKMTFSYKSLESFIARSFCHENTQQGSDYWILVANGINPATGDVFCSERPKIKIDYQFQINLHI